MRHFETEVLDRLKYCFYLTRKQWWGKDLLEEKNHFDVWLPFSNCPDEKTESECLTEILNILMKHPLADYFWYGYRENGSPLCFTLPSNLPGPVPGDALRVHKEKIMTFLRDLKIELIIK